MKERLTDDFDAKLVDLVPRDWESDPLPQLRALLRGLTNLSSHPGGNSRSSVEYAFSSLESLRQWHISPEIVEALLQIAIFYRLSDEASLAARAAAGAVDASVQGGFRELEVRARMAHGTVLKDAFDFAGSLLELTAALELSTHLGDASAQLRVLNNLAGWYVAAGQCETALQIYEDLAYRWKSLGDHTGFIFALRNAALAALRTGDFQRGLSLSGLQLSLAEPCKSAPECLSFVQGALTHCLLLIRSGFYAESSRCAEDAAAVAARSGSRLAMTLADVTHAIAGYVCGTRSRDSVVAFVESTKELSPATYVIALDAAIQAFEQAGPMDIALRLQNELMSFNRCRKFEEVELILGSSVQAAAEDVRRAERIEIEVDRKIECLLRIAVDQSVRAGADPARIFRVSKLAESFLQYSASPAPPLDVVSMAAKLIDVGTMVVPDDLLRKQRELFDGEREIAAKHAEFGAEILVNARLAVLQSCVPIVRYHHERWDGRGPCGLKGAAIPVGARLVSLCDAFDALCHCRPWRAALPIEQALLIIREGAGTQFDPELAVRFIDWVRRLRSQVPDLDAYLGAEALDNDYVRMRDRIERLVHGPA